MEPRLKAYFWQKQLQQPI